MLLSLLLLLLLLLSFQCFSVSHESRQCYGVSLKVCLKIQFPTSEIPFELVFYIHSMCLYTSKSI